MTSNHRMVTCLSSTSARFPALPVLLLPLLVVVMVPHPTVAYLPTSGLGQSWAAAIKPPSAPFFVHRAPSVPRGAWSRPSTRRMSGRDVMEVKGLPKANIMRTNSTATAYALDFDMSQSVLADLQKDMMLAAQDEAAGLLPSSEEGGLAAAGPSASVLSAAALIAGCMIGAGVLALPSVTVHSGFMPSTAAIAAVWTYCVASGLLIGEVCINTRGKASSASYLKIAGATVGRNMATVAFTLFSVFQYLLLVAYISQGGTLLNNFLELLRSFGMSIHLDGPLAPAAFTLGMGSLLTMGNKRMLENINNMVVTVVLVTFAALLVGGLPKVNLDLLMHSDMSQLHDVVPVAMCALVFQNVIPLISSSLKFDRSKVRSAILLGSGFPMLMYLAWNAVVIGNVPLELVTSGFDPIAMFHGAPEFRVMFTIFGLAAIVTSFIGSTLSIIEEFSEFLRGPNPGHVDLKEPSAMEKLPLYSVVLMPPLLAAVVYPEGFLSAIETSGGFGDPFLFGLLPVIMAWKQRYGAPPVDDESSSTSSIVMPTAADATAAALQSSEASDHLIAMTLPAEANEMMLGSSTSATTTSRCNAPTFIKAAPLLPGGKASMVLVALTTVAMFINKSSESMPFLRELFDHKEAAVDAIIQHASL